MKTLSTIFFATVTVASASAFASPIAVSTEMQPSQVRLGEDAELDITVSGEVARPQVPQVPGLSIQPSGQSRQVSIVNGAMSTQVSYSFIVSAERVGHFTVPALRVGNAMSAPAELDVVDAGTQPRAANRQRAWPPGFAGGLPQAFAQGFPPGMFGGGPSAANVAPPAANEQLAFARVVMPKRSLYVGESERIQFKAYFEPGTEVTITGQPTAPGSAFLVGNVSREPQQTQEVVGGREYGVCTWSATLSSIKDGHYPLVVQVPVTIRYRVEEQMPRFSGGLFDDDPFKMLQGMTAGFGRTKERSLTLSTKAIDSEVLALPGHAPASFSGAIGKFELKASLSDTHIATGDPATLTIVIRGSGNFDRVTTSGLAPSDAIKTYAPTSIFAGDESNGVKTFAQAIVPQQPGRQNVPPVSFSFFDPDTHQYVTRRTQPMAIDVTGDAAMPVAQAPHADPAVVDSGFQPNHIDLGTMSATMKPVFMRPWFAAAQAVPLFALASAFLIPVARRPRKGQKQRQAVRDALTDMERAGTRNDSVAFFSAARRALQHRLAQKWELSADAVTSHELEERCPNNLTLRQIFAFADDATYGGTVPDAGSLHEWQRRVHDTLDHLEDEAS